MNTRKKKKLDKFNDAKLVVRIEANLRDEFVATCRDLDTTASREIRRYIRDFLSRCGDKPSGNQEPV
jgi:hypothetical protein